MEAFQLVLLLTTANVAKCMDRGAHGTTFGGNPLACTVAMAVIDEIGQPAFLIEVEAKSAHLMSGLEKLVKLYPRVFAGTPGDSLLQGVKTICPNAEFEAKCLQSGLVLMAASDNTVRLLPPLTISRPEIDIALDIMKCVCSKIDSENRI